MSRARSLALDSAGSSNAARMARMAMTTSSSMSVNPFRFLRLKTKVSVFISQGSTLLLPEGLSRLIFSCSFVSIRGYYFPNEIVTVVHFDWRGHGCAAGLRPGPARAARRHRAQIPAQPAAGRRADAAGHGVVCLQREHRTHR